jgi:hypothetical protein
LALIEAVSLLIASESREVSTLAGEAAKDLRS